MRNLRHSLFLVPGLLWLTAVTPVTGAETPPRELPVLMTEDGRDYVDVKILRFDPEGPIFRHRDGMAKIPFRQIKEKTRKLLGYPMAVQAKPAQPAAGKAAKVATGATAPLIPVRITTRWAVFQPAQPRATPCRQRPLHPWFHHQAAWPFEDPFRPFAAVDFLVIGGVVPHHGWPGPGWRW